MSGGRLPAHLEVAALIRAAEADGGFAAVLSKGEREGGAIYLTTCERGRNSRLWERMPRLDGRRIFTVSREQDTEKPHEYDEYLQRRMARDDDGWLIELDVVDAERFIAQLAD